MESREERGRRKCPGLGWQAIIGYTATPEAEA